MAIHPTPGKFADIGGGVELYYEERGEGQPLIFIPGWTFTTEVFEKQLEYFSKNYRVIAYDPRSHGRSTVTHTGNDYITHGEDLAALIAALDLKDVILAGWSFGCLSAWSYLRAAGVSNVKALVMIDLSPKPLSVTDGDWVEGPLDEIAGAYTAYLRTSKGQREFIEYYATNVMVQRELSPEELFWIIEQSAKTPVEIAASLFASGMFSDYREEAKLADASVPVLSVVAEHWAETAVPFFASVSPKAQSFVLGGHLMFWEHADAFNAKISEFLASV